MNDFSTRTFTRSRDALEALGKDALPDLLVLDMRMPETSGPDFCAELRKNRRYDALKIVFFTASSDLDHDILKKYGVLGFIFKPFDNDQLVKSIRHYLSLPSTQK
jgi:CheY-like chemotaxis protein